MTNDATHIAHSDGRPKPPETMMSDFRQFRGSGDATHWQLGDKIDEWVVEMAGKLSQARVYKAAALETEQSVGEIRKLHETARGTDAQLRAEFEDVLTSEHYRVLRYVDDRAKKLAYLKLCVESADDFNGRPMPAVILAKRVRKDSGLELPPPTFGDLIERAIAAVGRARDAAAGSNKYEKVTEILLALEKLA